MTCRLCHDTGLHTFLEARDPHGPVAYHAPVTRYCECAAGWDRKAAEIEASEAAFAREATARAYADAMMVRAAE